VVFILNAILLPIAFFWGLVRLFRVMTGGLLAARFEEKIKGKIVPH